MMSPHRGKRLARRLCFIEKMNRTTRLHWAGPERVLSSDVRCFRSVVLPHVVFEWDELPLGVN